MLNSITPPPPAVVHIWYAGLNPAPPLLARLEACLSPEEWARLRRFHFARDARRYAVRRGLLRHLLGAYLGQTAQSIAFAYGAQGKPALAGHYTGNDLRFNLSDSDEMAVYAFSARQEVGVDIEAERPMEDAAQLAERNFSPEEYAWLRAHSPGETSRAFLRCWTCKEAVVKALGNGLMAPLQEFTAAHWETPPRLGWSTPPGVRWTLRLLDPPPGYHAALALPAPVREIIQRPIHHLLTGGVWG